MGLKLTTGYEVKDMGITIPEAYAKISYVNINENGMANAVINIQQTRDDVINKTPLDRVYIKAQIDKELPIYSQLYIVAKEKEIFAGWEDDIVESL